MVTINEELMPHQMAFINSKKSTTMMITGRGGGKSFIVARKCIALISQGKSMLVAAPTYKQLKQTIFKAIIDALNLYKIRYKYNKSEMTIKVGDQIIYGSSGESYDSARGITDLTALVVDEAALIDEEAIEVWAACLRGQYDPEMYFVSTPRGTLNWLYKYSKKDDVNLITATTFDNFKVSKRYHEILRDMYGNSKFAEQELMGGFVDFSAGVLDYEWLTLCGYKAPPASHIVRSYDLAVSTKTHSDYTATCLLSEDDGTFTIHDMDRWQKEWPDTKKMIIANSRKDGRHVPIYVEAFATQKGLVQDLQRCPELRGYIVKGIAPQGDKLNKILPFAVRMESGMVRIVNALKILGDLRDEMNAFAGDGKQHDDLIDSMALAYFGLVKQVPALAHRAIKGLY